MKRLVISVVLAVALVIVPASGVLAATTDTVTVTASPSYVEIANAPDTWAIGAVTAGVDDQTANDFFTITNGSGVAIDITIQVTTDWAFTSGSNSWTYGAPGADTGQLKASSGEGNGASGGSGLFDITLEGQAGSAVLLINACPTITSPQWELQLDAPSSFTHGDPQDCTVTLSAAPD
ncbi:MAG: hypothetical protein D4S01_03655 [Dehalococcoidia bacterium]|nr:MAG: hypothetical protein D4S01_03655 [Dehalococcoidia bacterium]